MKFQVIMKIENAKATTMETKVDLVFGPRDTVSEVKKRILEVQPTPFPEQKLTFKGRALSDDATLAECGVVEGSSVDFVIVASQEALSQQLCALLKSRPVAPQELSLLYCHRHGVTVAQALQDLGLYGGLEDFLLNQKGLVLEGGLVKTPTANLAACKPTKGMPVAVTVRVEAPKGTEESSIDLHVDPESTVRSLKERVAAIELIPFPDTKLLLAGNTLEDDMTLKDCRVCENCRLLFTVSGSIDALAAQLVEILRHLPDFSSSPAELSHLYCYRHGASLVQALRSAGWRQDLRSFLESSEQICVLKGGCVTIPGKPGLLESIPEGSSNVVDQVLHAILTASFLNVSRISKGDSSGIAEAVLYLNGLPPIGQDKWMPGLLKAVASTLTEVPCLSETEVMRDALQVQTPCGSTVLIRIESAAAA